MFYFASRTTDAGPEHDAQRFMTEAGASERAAFLNKMAGAEVWAVTANTQIEMAPVPMSDGEAATIHLILLQSLSKQRKRLEAPKRYSAKDQREREAARLTAERIEGLLPRLQAAALSKTIP